MNGIHDRDYHMGNACDDSNPSTQVAIEPLLPKPYSGQFATAL